MSLRVEGKKGEKFCKLIKCHGFCDLKDTVWGGESKNSIKVDFVARAARYNEKIMIF